MKTNTISIIGAGYVGLVTGVCFADKGYRVYLVDVIPEKVDIINRGKSPIYEPELETMLQRNVRRGRLEATLNLEEAIQDSSVSFITVETPSKPSGLIDFDSIRSVAEELGKVLKNRKDYHIITVKSTVIPNTTENVILPILEKSSGKKSLVDFDIAFCPEFLREGSAINDFLNPDRVVIGARNISTTELISSLFYWLSEESVIFKTDIRTAEMIKYASNAFLATKISFINEIANICEKLQVPDVYKVAEGMGLDYRISKYFLRAGCGFGGSCFPKDVKALIASSVEAGYDPLLLKSVIEINEKQSLRLIDLAFDEIETLEDLRVAVLGIAFNPGTDDIRESPAIRLIDALLEKRAKVICYDPKAMDNAKNQFGEKVQYAKSIEAALDDTNLCIVTTSWPEFERISPKIFLEHMKKPLVIDGRRTFDQGLFLGSGVLYRRIGLTRD